MWDLNQIKLADTITVRVVNKRGDRNLDGMILKGEVKEIVESHQMVRLDSGWCCHTKDELLSVEAAEAGGET